MTRGKKKMSTIVLGVNGDEGERERKKERERERERGGGGGREREHELIDRGTRHRWNPEIM